MRLFFNKQDAITKHLLQHNPFPTNFPSIVFHSFHCIVYKWKTINSVGPLNIFFISSKTSQNSINFTAFKINKRFTLIINSFVMTTILTMYSTFHMVYESCKYIWESKLMTFTQRIFNHHHHHVWVESANINI